MPSSTRAQPSNSVDAGRERQSKSPARQASRSPARKGTVKGRSPTPGGNRVNFAKAPAEEQQYPRLTPLGNYDWVSAPRPGSASPGRAVSEQPTKAPGATKIIPIVKRFAKPPPGTGGAEDSQGGKGDGKKGKGKGKGKGNRRARPRGKQWWKSKGSGKAKGKGKTGKDGAKGSAVRAKDQG